MSDLKMSDVFKLPLVPVDYQNGIEGSDGNIIVSGDEHHREKVAMCHAINSHDKLTAELAEAKSEIDRLRDALTQSQKVMNTFGLIHGDKSYSHKEKCARAETLIDRYMDDAFTTNKQLLNK
ncbi:coil containing protein [Vibrio phage 1.084.O._10N.261.49.F5]|nr:coil containing protein [Vibrio phage 1.084.O._10N.261.49.F5]